MRCVFGERGCDKYDEQQRRWGSLRKFFPPNGGKNRRKKGQKKKKKKIGPSGPRFFWEKKKTTMCIEVVVYDDEGAYGERGKLCVLEHIRGAGTSSMLPRLSDPNAATTKNANFTA